MTETNEDQAAANMVAEGSPANIPTLQPPNDPPSLFTFESYTLTHADTARINCHLEREYVEAGLAVTATRKPDGAFGVQVYDVFVPLGVE